jgi:hypothetical protein
MTPIEKTPAHGYEQTSYELTATSALPSRAEIASDATDTGF